MRLCYGHREWVPKRDIVTAGPWAGKMCRRCRRKGWFPEHYLKSEAERIAENKERVAAKMAQSPTGPWKWPVNRYQRRRIAEAHGHRCAICQATDKRLSVDHDHASGWVRGLLCAGCNFALGAFADNIDALRRAITYLEAPPLAPRLDE